MNNSISNEIMISLTKNETIETTNENKKTTTIKNLIRKSMTKKEIQNLHRHQSRDSDDHEHYVLSNRVLNFEHNLFST